MIPESIAINGLYIAGRAIFSHAILDTYELIKGFQFHPKVAETLDNIDLQADLEVVSALVKEVGDRHHDELSKDDSPLVIRLRQVDEMVKLIQSELELIKKETQEHDQKYFAVWRTPDYDQYLRKIVCHKKTLDKRVVSLIKLLKIF